MTTGVVAALVPRDAVLVTGNDAASYLQGQISQDVDAVEVGTSAWSLVLAPQGKVDAWFRLTRLDENEFLVDLDAGFAEGLVARLERFKLRVDAAFEIMEGWRMLSIRGSADADGLDAVQAELRTPVAWPGFEGVDLLGPEVSLPAGAEDSTAAMEIARIRAGWPAMGRELTERTIPAEIAGLVESSVSFTKGCYTGQELVARIDSRGGNVPRPVRLLEIRGGGVSPGAEITVDGKTVGEITSAAADPASAATVALGPVHRRVEPPASAEVNGMPATVLATPASLKAG